MPVNFYNPLFIILALTGLAFLIAGFLIIKKPPQQINSIYGYRTRRSMISQAIWDFAQKKSGEELIIFGTFQIIIAIIGLFYDIQLKHSMIIGLSIIILCTILVFVRTERAIIEKFK